MNKVDVVNRIAAQTDFYQKDISRMIDVFMEVVMEAVAEGRSVKFKKFGTFEPRVHKARLGMNPSTQQRIPVPEKKVARFDPAQEFKRKMLSIEESVE